MRMRSWIILLFLLLVPVVHAAPNLVIDPNITDVYVLQNTKQSFEVNISNIGDKEAKNLSFTDISGFSFPTGISINPGEMKKVSFNVTASASIPSQVSTTLSFFYTQNASMGGDNLVITIGSESYIPKNVEVFKTDTLTFKNIDTVDHSVTQFSPAGINEVLSPGEEYVLTTDQVDTFYYKDVVYNNLSMTVKVKENEVEQLVSEPTLNKLLTINYHHVLEKSNLSLVSIVPASYSMDYRETQEGVIVLNTNITTYNVRPTSRWIVFQDYDFTMNSGNKPIPFTIVPSIELKNSATGMTYNETITVTSSNSDEFNITVPIYILPYDFGSFTYNNTNCPAIPIYTIEGVENVLSFCTANPDYGRCPELFVLIKEVPVKTPIPLTYDEVHNAFTAADAAKGSAKIAENAANDASTKLSTCLDTMRTEIQGLCNAQLGNQTEYIASINQNLEIMNERENMRESDWQTIYAGLMIFVFLIALYVISIKRKFTKWFILGRRN